ncbi:DUF4113 domain-containing protein [Azospirillum melinis]
MDAINGRMGLDTLVPAAVGFRKDQSWAMQQGSQSPDYTTRLQDVPLAQC